MRNCNVSIHKTFLYHDDDDDDDGSIATVSIYGNNHNTRNEMPIEIKPETAVDGNVNGFGHRNNIISNKFPSMYHNHDFQKQSKR